MLPVVCSVTHESGPQFVRVDGFAFADISVPNGGGPYVSSILRIAALNCGTVTLSAMMSRCTGLKTMVFAP